MAKFMLLIPSWAQLLSREPAYITPLGGDRDCRRRAHADFRQESPGSLGRHHLVCDYGNASEEEKSYAMCGGES